MGQRLGIASALLGDPRTVVLDEPVNGLDPEGVLWIRELLQDLAAAGRTVLISSHLMSEMAQTASRLVVIGRGRLIADTTVDDFVAMAAGATVSVRTSEPDRLAGLLTGPDVNVTIDLDNLQVTGLSTDQVGTIAWHANLPVYELARHQPSLEDAFLQLTQDAVEYKPTSNGGTAGGGTGGATAGTAGKDANARQLVQASS